MQTDKKILFTDLDGTLLDDGKNITPGNRAALEEAVSGGHTVVLSTGRPLASVLALAEHLGLSEKGFYAILYNGGQIFDFEHRTSIYSRTIPMDLVRPLFDLALLRGIHIQTYNATHVLAEHDNDILRDYQQFTGMPYQVVSDIEAALTEAPHKLLAIRYNSHQRLVSFQDEIGAAYRGVLDSFFSSDSYLEIVPANVSKGQAVRWMCDYLGVPLDHSVAAGDAPNDISMLEAAHVGAVMRNAFPGVAEHGNYLTQADNNHDGLAEIIRRFIL